MSRWYFATPNGSSSGHSTAPPSPATSPTWTCVSANTASSAAMTMSQNRAMVAPRPMAYPCTTQMIGCGTSNIVYSRSLLLNVDFTRSGGVIT